MESEAALSAKRLRDLLTDWDGKPLADETTTRVEVHCGDLRRLLDECDQTAINLRHWREECGKLHARIRVMQEIKDAALLALQEAKKLAALAADLTGCRGDDEYVWGVQKQIESAISKARGKDAP